MLGEQVGEFTGKVTSQRVLPSDSPGAQASRGAILGLEVSVEMSGAILGVQGTFVATYIVQFRPDGTPHGQGQGVIMTQDRDVVTLTGEGKGHYSGRGMATNFRGALYYQTGSQKLARLNDACHIFEWDVDEVNNVHATLWEWK